jgi:hypothetical protein
LVALDKKNPAEPVTIITLGIVPEAQRFYGGDLPLIHEVWLFCKTCGRRIFDAYYYSAESRFGREEFRLLATVPGGSPVDPERGHFLSVAEYLPGRIGRAFEVQVGAVFFRRLLERWETEVSFSVYWKMAHGECKPIGFDPPPARCEPVG